jgi:serine/threonine-protein kinase
MSDQKYEIMERIGAGGMAEVFKASSTSLEGFKKLVAIKRVLPSLTQNERFVRMFLDEAKISLPLNHTNIVQTFDLGKAGSTYFIVMEYVEGTNLKSVIENLADNGKRLSVAEAAHIGLELCEGLSHAHKKTDNDGEPLNIVHRDVSPPNVLVSGDGEIKITDFGLAKAKSQAEATDPGVVKGKFGYLSPEAAQGEDVDGRTDIFAVGILLWEMLTGRRLFLGESDYDTLELVREAEIPPLSDYGRDVPPTFERIMRRTLAREVEDRYQHAEQLGQDLAKFLYQHGQVVTSFDIARRVREAIGPIDTGATAPSTSEGRERAKEIQREINQFVSVEEIGNLDLKMADAATKETANEADVDPDADFEDPRSWTEDIGGLEEEPSNPSGEMPSDMDESDTWQRGGLEQVARATQSMSSIDADEAKRQAQQGGEAAAPGAGQPQSQQDGGPPTVPPTDEAAPADQTQPGASDETQPLEKERVQQSSRAGDAAKSEQPPPNDHEQTGSEEGADSSKEGAGLAVWLVALIVVLGVAAGAYVVLVR